MVVNYLVMAIFLVATYNAAAAIMGWKLRWSIALYWALVAAYWLLRFMEKGG